jgi:hypothetical protein
MCYANDHFVSEDIINEYPMVSAQNLLTEYLFVFLSTSESSTNNTYHTLDTMKPLIPLIVSSSTYRRSPMHMGQRKIFVRRAHCFVVWLRRLPTKTGSLMLLVMLK